jgi:hypothetical protein
MAKTKDTQEVILRTFPAELHIRVKIQAAKEQTTMQEIFVRACEMYLKRKGG